VGQKPSTSDFSAAATSMQSYFANSDETGFTANMQTWILANPTLFKTENPSAAQLQAGFAQLQSLGLTSSYNSYVQTLTGDPLADREAFFSFVQTSGLKAYHANLVSSLNVLSARNHRSGQLSYASAHGKGGKLVLINAWTFSWASAGIYLGIVGLVICTGGAGAVVCLELTSLWLDSELPRSVWRENK
jgi:hypothetical protein